MALLLRADCLRVLFGIRTLFEIESLEIEDGDRIGLVGANGSGKSTLLSVLHGDRSPSSGAVRRFCRSAMVRQFGGFSPPEESALPGAESFARNASAAIDPAIRARLHAKASAHEGISGGELERLRIARALSQNVPLLFADEPTTNLDFDGQREVKRALMAHRGALVLVSHDRDLLDSVCTRIWALEGGALRVFPGNYSAYRAQRETELEFQRDEYAQYRAEQSRLRASIAGLKEASGQVRKAPRRMGNSEARLHKRGGGAGAKKRLDQAAGALKSRLDNLEAKERPREEGSVRMGLAGHGGITSAAAVRAESLTLARGGQTLLKKASFTVPTGRRTVLVGPNGCGKTTLLRAIRDGMGGIRLSPGVTIGWFGQEGLDAAPVEHGAHGQEGLRFSGSLDPSLTLLENIMRDSVLPEHQTRAILARMGLGTQDMEKPAAVLSGGERAKAALARLMAGNASLLLLDEPSNHLDLRALEALEDMLSGYEGTLLLVSHDRRMIDRVAHRLLLMEGGALASFEGNLTDYERRLEPKAEDSLSEDILRMRLSALLGRMSAPRKGDVREALEEEYDALQAQLKLMRK